MKHVEKERKGRRGKEKREKKTRWKKKTEGRYFFVGSAGVLFIVFVLSTQTHTS